ncbi:MAG: AAA domain-containing protein, partial [Myxococcota bacterium]|nr:AAA domain-containing protein [Myxococcota bacterium]
IIDAREWDASREAYVVSARAKAHSAKTERYMAPNARLPDLSPRGWYLYASTLDIWQSRLERAIAERHLEDSWLGDRRAYLMGLMPADEQLLPPRENRFDVVECAMYAPELLPATPVEDDFEILTPSHPPLDDSKKEAIAMVFHNPMSCILGPPGTGKSQTIAALIDEYLCRHPEGPVKILVSASSYEPMSVVLDKLQSHRDAAGNPTRAASIEKVWLRATSREGLDREDVRDFCLDTGRKRMYLDGEQIKRGKKSRLYEGEKWRMDDELPDRFILFGVPFQLSQLLRRKDGLGEYLHIEHFAFDLVIVDEASQMPVDQATTLLPLIRRGCVETAPLPVLDDKAPLTDAAMVEAMHAERVVGVHGNVLSAEDLTRIILVGDHNQLPPVQQIEPPEKLRAILESAFAYFQQHLGVPSTQLQTNYRSREEVVAYTNSLDLYEHPVIPFFADHPGIEPLPSPPDPCPTWLESLLEDGCVVSALVH